ncbi:hypothetical protein D9M68_920800 [compost metagenome]
MDAQTEPTAVELFGMGKGWHIHFNLRDPLMIHKPLKMCRLPLMGVKRAPLRTW